MTRWPDREISRWLLSVVVGMGVVGAAPQQSPPTPQTTFRTTTDLVQVDVVVVDKDGNPIRDLKAGDFALLDRKKPQTIATFEEISHDSSAESEPAADFPPTLKLDVASNRSAQSDRLVVMIVDDLHIYQGRTDKAKDLARQVIGQLGPKASMAVLFTSGDHSTQVTEDRSQLLEAVGTLKGRQSFRRPNAAIDAQIGGIDANQDLDTVIGAIQKFQNAKLEDFFNNMTQYKTLEDAARMLGSDDARRKAFVMVSEGIAKDLTGMFEGAMTPCEATCSSCPCYHDRSLREMMESLRRASVATYNLDPRGHVSAQELLQETFPSPPGGLLATKDGRATDEDSQFRWDNPIRQAQDGLKIMAEASGGFAVTDTDDYTSGLKHIIEDIDHYYLLGFYPADPSGRGYRPLDVTVVNHPEWTLRFRKGYMSGGPPPPPKNTDPLVSLSAGVMPKTDLPLRLTAVALPGLRPAGASGIGKTARVVAALEITAPTQSLVETDTKLRDDISYEVLVIDDKKSKVTSRSGLAARMVLHGRDSGGPMPDLLVYQVETTLDLLPGRYDLRASAMSTKLGKGGSVYFTVDVPDFTSAPLLISGLALGYAEGARVPVGRAAAPPHVLPFDVALDREFTTFDTLRVYFELARTGQPSPTDLTIELIDASDAVVMTVTDQVPAGDSGHVDRELRLSDRATGAYRLRVTAKAGSQSAQREIGLVLR